MQRTARCGGKMSSVTVDIGGKEEVMVEVELPIQKELNNSPVRSTLQTVYLAVSYAIIFMGYYSANSFVSVIQPYAFVGWALLYVFYFLSSIAAPLVAKRMGLRTTISACAFCYILYIAAVNSGISALYLVASCMIGCAAGTIWLFQGIWLNRQAVIMGPGTEGFMSGLFYTIFNFQGIVGNAVGIPIFLLGFNISVYIWVMCGVTAIGFVLSWFIAPLKVPDLTSEQAQPATETLLQRVRTIAVTSIEKDVLLLWPMFFLQSSQLVFSYQILPVRVVTGAAAYGYSGPLLNVYTFMCYFFGAMLSSFVCGKLFDRFGYKTVLVPEVVMEVSTLLLCLFFILFGVNPYVWLPIGFLRGMSDYTVNNLILAVISMRFKARSSILLGLYRGLYALGFVCFGLIAGLVPLAPYFWLMGITAVLLPVSVFFMVVLFHRPLTLLDAQASTRALDLYRRSQMLHSSSSADATSSTATTPRTSSVASLSESSARND